MGLVTLTDLNSGQTIWQGQNSTTQTMQQRIIQGLARGVAVPPLYCAVGSSYATLSDTPWVRTRLQSEMLRVPINGTFVDPISGQVGVVTVFTSNSGNTIWKELALFDASEIVDYGFQSATSCDVLKYWTTGVGNVISIDYVNPVEGIGQVTCTGDTALILQGNVLNFISNFTDSVTAWDKSLHLQMHLNINNPTLLNPTNGLTISLYYTAPTVHAQWTVLPTALTIGRNFLDLSFQDATLSFTAAIANGLQISGTGRAPGLTISLDQIRIYRESGHMLARTEIYPAYAKVSGVNLAISWIFNPFPEA